MAWQRPVLPRGQHADPRLVALSPRRALAQREVHLVAVDRHAPVDVGPGVERRMELEHRRHVRRRVTQPERPGEAARRHAGHSGELLGHQLDRVSVASHVSATAEANDSTSR